MDENKNKVVTAHIIDPDKHMEMFQNLFSVEEASFLMAAVMNETFKYVKTNHEPGIKIGVQCLGKMIQGLPEKSRPDVLEILKSKGMNLLITSTPYPEEALNFMEAQAQDITESLNLKAKGYSAQGSQT